MVESPIQKNRMYYEALGRAKARPNYRDFYRFGRVRRYLLGNSVLDVGCCEADFLNLIKSDYQIAGIEVNGQRVDYCNQVLGGNAVKLGNLDDKLDFEDGSFDNVTCLEVLEHLVDPEKALKELVRISRKRVIITVPFNEKIRYVLCLHCAQYTPISGHLHTFNRKNIRDIIPDNAGIVKIELICNKALRYLPGLRSVLRLPMPISLTIDKISNRVVSTASWMMVVLDKE